MQVLLSELHRKTNLMRLLFGYLGSTNNIAQNIETLKV
jgi:hypothetical protein